jgi:hypothetical protein
MAMLVLPTFFFWRWLLKKFIKADGKRKIITWVATIVLTPLIYYGFIMLVAFYLSYYPNLHFNKTGWESKPNKRYELSKNLIESKILIGKSRAQLRQLLGSDYSADDSDVLYYALGNTPVILNFDPDPFTLQINLKNNKIISVEQYKEWGN